MIKIHLAQIYYNTAYYDSPIDYLEESLPFNEKDAPLGKLRSIEGVQEFLVESKGLYIEHIRSKLKGIANWSGKNNCHLLVFPEYSVPPQILLDLQKIAKKHSMIIVAGSHRVQAGNHVESIYRDLKIYESSNFMGTACSPILCPDGTVYVAKKIKKSKWEPNLSTPEEKPKTYKINCKEQEISLSVIPCIDSLHIDVIGTILNKKDQRPDLIICPSESPKSSLFADTANLLAASDILFCYVNTADAGGTFFNIPDSWETYLKGHSHVYKKLPPKTESILELTVQANCFFTKKGSLDVTPICYHPFPLPIIYTKESDWIADIENFQNEILEFLESSDNVSAIEWTDEFLSEKLSTLPKHVGFNIKHLRHHILPLFDGNIDDVQKTLQYVYIKDIDNTISFWSIRVNKAIDFLTNLIKDTPDELIDYLFTCIKTLKKSKTKLPNVLTTRIENSITDYLTSHEPEEFQGETEIIESFQNRGFDIDQVRNFLINPDNKVIIITGAVGIGKSSFVDWMFKKQFGDWDVLRIKIVKESRTPRLLSEIAYRMDVPLDIDSLSTVTGNVFRQITKKIFTKFYQKQKRALVIDDLHDILRSGTARDHKQLSIIIDEAASCRPHVGGRIFIVSSQWLPWNWINQKGVAHVPLRKIKAKYTRRIIEFHMRRCNLIQDESIPQPPQDLIDLVNGHPLSARLVVDALHEKNFDELSNDLKLEDITGYLAKKLLKHISLSEKQKSCLQLLSIFRKPIDLNIFNKVSGDKFKDIITQLLERCVVSFDGKYLEMHEAVRRYFIMNIQEMNIDSFHAIAANYYQYLYEKSKDTICNNPSIAAEFVHHLSLSGQIDKAKDLKLLIVEEIKPTARKFYKELKQYDKALSLYRLLQKIVPDDVEVLAYIGRCNARLGQWIQCDQSFEAAIEVARRLGHSVWWLYRDWGHIKARYNYFDEAQEYFDKASRYRPNDPSIKSSLAYMHWRQNEREEARRLFEEVINDNPYHRYTLTFYSRFLEEEGEYEYARLLKQRLEELEDDFDYRQPLEYDIDEDYDD